MTNAYFADTFIFVTIIISKIKSKTMHIYPPIDIDCDRVKYFVLCVRVRFVWFVFYLPITCTIFSCLILFDLIDTFVYVSIATM